MEQSKFYKIKNITEDKYTLVGCDGSETTRPIQEVDKTASVFTIQDAKDGDVLKEDSCLFIIERMKPNGIAIVHCCLFDDGDFDLVGSNLSFDVDSTYPATKEQRDQLEKAITAAGYKWNAEKKELRKIEQKSIECIQWTGKNLKEVIDFTGKSARFDEWFKSWDEYEAYVHSHGDIFKLFCADGSHYEVPVGAWIIKTPDGCNTPSQFNFIQKSTEWSEEDEKILEIVTSVLQVNFEPEERFSGYEEYMNVDLINWLKSLKERMKGE